MLAELLFRVRQRLPDPIRLLGSWRLSVVLTVMLALDYGLLAVFAFLSSPEIVQGIGMMIPFWGLYALLLTNTALCLWRRLPVLRRELRGEPMAIKTVVAETRSTPASMTETEARSWLTVLGFEHLTRVGSGVWGVRRARASLGTYFFHGAFFVLAVAVGLTVAGKQEHRIWVAEGETYSGNPAQVLSRPSGSLASQPRTVPNFTVSSITPEFWGNVLLFTRLESLLTMDDGRVSITRINRPLHFGFATFLRMSGFGYAVRYELSDRDGKVLESLFVKLNVFPPGQHDFFALDRFPHRIGVEVLPDVVETEGEFINRSFNLTEPAVRVTVSRGKLWVGEAILQPDDHLDFEGLRLSFPEIRYWGEFSIVRDPGAPFLFAAMLLGIVGLIIKVRGGRCEVLWSPDPAGGSGRMDLWGPVAHLPKGPGSEEGP